MTGANRAKIKRLIPVLSTVLLCALISVSFAWFIFDETATVRNQSDMQITAGDRLEISLDGKNWGHTLEPEFEKTPLLPDITGDGKVFYYPMVLDANDKTVDSPASFYTIDMSKKHEVDMYMITLKLYFRSASDMVVYLSDTSYVNPKDTNITAENKSMFGQISADFIAGAVRVAFLEQITETDENGNETVSEVLKNIWVPNEKIQLSYNKGSAYINTEGTLETFENSVYPYGYMSIQGEDENAKVTASPYTWKDYAEGKVTIGTEKLAKSSSGSDPAGANCAAPLLNFTGDSGKIEEKVLIVRIWVEGTDREADKALVGGSMNYAFNFIGIKKLDRQEESDKENPENKVNILDKLTLNSQDMLIYDGKEPGKDMFEFSYDGIAWTPYTAQVLRNANADKQEVYVRFQETEIYLPSDIKTLTWIKNQQNGNEVSE
ncbi:MAG: hypothetical protein E7674_05440 [Ruminococcaceae bacterium]|nr:hypothetical protein [Oscillospiraceae bacterium]